MNIFPKKPIREFSNTCAYLKNSDAPVPRPYILAIEDAEFDREEFYDTVWERCQFRRCHFPASHLIRLRELKHCDFHDCTFGPSRWDDALGFGTVENARFYRCEFKQANISFGGDALFERCTFQNPSDDPNQGYFLSGDNVRLNLCSAQNYGWKGRERLHLLKCDFAPSAKSSGDLMSGVGPATKDKPIVADFILEECTLKNVEEVLWNIWVKNLTIRRCKVDGVFRTQQGYVKDTLVLEDLTEGIYDITNSGTENKIVIKGCRFTKADPKTTYLFRSTADYASNVFIENIICGDAAPLNLTAAGPDATEKYRMPATRSKTFVLQNSKIPVLWANWLMSHDLLIENCEIGRLELKDARLGKVTIRNTRYGTLDLSRTLAAQYDIAPSGQIVSTESNFPKGGYDIK